MGHSPGRSVTESYIAEFPLDRQKSFNARLLADTDATADSAENLLSGLSQEMRQELLKHLLKG